MTKHTTLSANAGMKMSLSGRIRMRRREREVLNYYDDMGLGKGNCTWGTGILAHKGPCTTDELAKHVNRAMAQAEFARRVAEAEAGVVRQVRNQRLTQSQFDALVSLTYNAGVRGCRRVYTLVDTGRTAQAAAEIRSITSTRINGKKVLARGLVSRRSEESAPFAAAALATAVAQQQAEERK